MLSTIQVPFLPVSAPPPPPPPAAAALVFGVTLNFKVRIVVCNGMLQCTVAHHPSVISHRTIQAQLTLYSIRLFQSRLGNHGPIGQPCAYATAVLSLSI